MKRHPEMQLIENLRVESLIEEASQMYAKVRNVESKRTVILNSGVYALVVLY